MTTIRPRRNDVLFGKGGAINTHHGNVQFRSIVESQKQKFIQSKRAEKKEVAKQVANKIQGLGGRFLMEEKKAKANGRGSMDPGGDSHENVKRNSASPDADGTQKVKVKDYVTEYSILQTKWVLVDEELIMKKVMHRLREKIKTGCKQGPFEPKKNPFPPSVDAKSTPAVKEKNKVPPSGYVKLPLNGLAAPRPKGEAVPETDAKISEKNNSGDNESISNTFAQKDKAVQDVKPEPQPIKKTTKTTTKKTTKKIEAKVEQHSKADMSANQANPIMDNSFVDSAPILASTQSTLHPVDKNHSSMKNFAQSPTPVNIQYWIKMALATSPFPDEYLRDAVNLSYLLAKQLTKMIAATAITLSDIEVEKVVIFLEPLSELQSSKNIAIHAVQFRQDAPPLSPVPQSHQRETLPFSQHAVCGAFGKILLEIFSKGGANLTETLMNTMESSHCTQSTNPSMPPSQKRTALDPIKGSITSRVNNLLIEVGMPLSIRQLVCDLLGNVDELRPETALASMEEMLCDLNRMKKDPQHFLFDRTCPQKALDYTSFFANTEKHLYGRKREIDILTRTKQDISNHVYMSDEMSMAKIKSRENIFHCEAAFLSGYAGSGKSHLLHHLIHACKEDNWFILNCKFDKHSTPIMIMAKAFDDFFGRWVPRLDSAMDGSFHRVCLSIFSTIDKEGLIQLLEIIPNLGKISPEVQTDLIGYCRDQGSSSIDKVGFGTKRRTQLFQVLIKSLCSSGRPVLITLDDLQWSDSTNADAIEGLILNYRDVPCVVQDAQKEKYNHGLMLVGTFRSNESRKNEGILDIINSIERSENAKVTQLDIEDLTPTDVGKFLSATLCLPLRHTQELAGLVHLKTRGNPFFVNQFLKTIIRNRMLQFGVKSRRWKWDCDVINMQMISDGVAELLATRYNQLHHPLKQTVKIASCFGSQIDDLTIDLLSSEEHLLPFDVKGVLQLAITEGIVEKAGPLYQFTHDLIQQTIYESIPNNERKLLHKVIGTVLLRSAANNSTIHLLAVDQINLYCQDADLGSQERSHIARINATAAKFAISASNFEQARSYVNAGMRLLNNNRWKEEYSLSLQLYEMSAAISCFNGDVDGMSWCLREAISNVISFEDSLTSSGLLAMLLAASSKYQEAISNCLSILSSLGEEFPREINLGTVLNELAVIQNTLANISVGQVKLLPAMADKTKLNAMKFLSMVCSYSIQSKPMLVPILSCRMVRLTMENGFCDDSIVGLVTAGFSLFSFADNVELGYQIGKVGEFFIEESPNRHALRSRLSFELDGTLKAVVEPAQSVVALFHDRYDSAMLAGDVGGAMHSLLSYCLGKLHTGSELVSLSKFFVACIKQSTKYQQNFVRYLAMSAYHLCIALSGTSSNEVDIMSFEELNQIGKREKHLQLLYQNFFNEMLCYFWDGDYVKVVELTKKHKPTGRKRSLEITRTIFEGIASLNLARTTHQESLRKIGEDSLQKMLRWEQISKWNWEAATILIRAELHYFDGDINSAKAAYKAAIASACAHKFRNYEALGRELYGNFCVENGMVKEGKFQHSMALDKYKQWGAMRKVEKVLKPLITTLYSAEPALTQCVHVIE